MIHRALRLSLCVFLIAFLFVPFFASAATYYIDPSRGDDSGDGRSGTNTGSSKPWKTLGRASIQRYRNGDSLLLVCGQEHKGHLKLSIAGGLGELEVAGYGACEQLGSPVIEASISLNSTEISKSGKRHFNIEDEPGGVIADGVKLAKSFSKFTVEVPRGGPIGVAPYNPQSSDISGAQAYARTQDWLVEKVDIPINEGDVSLPNIRTKYPLRNGAQIFVTGKIWALKENRWIYDKIGKELIVLSNAKDLRIVEQVALISVRGSGSVSISGIVLRNAGDSAIDVAIEGNVKISGCVIRGSSNHAVYVKAAKNVSISGNQIEWSSGDGVRIGSADFVEIEKNRIVDTGVFEDVSLATSAVDVFRARRSRVSSNRIERSGYVGIRFSNGAEILFNSLFDSCLHLSDCGAIYTWSKQPYFESNVSIVTGNLVVNVKGNHDFKLGYRVWAAGIYLDDFTSMVEVSSNVIVGARQGIYIHNAFANKLLDNLTIGDTEYSFAGNFDNKVLLEVFGGALGNELKGVVAAPSVDASAALIITADRIKPFHTPGSIKVNSFGGKSKVDHFRETKAGVFEISKDGDEFISVIDVRQSKLRRGLSDSRWSCNDKVDSIVIENKTKTFRVSPVSETITDDCIELMKSTSGVGMLKGAQVRLSICDRSASANGL